MSKFEERKAFNFYSSYYEVAKELPKKDRDEFVWCIVHAQFTGELLEPKSKLAKLMWRGQLHSIKKQLTGYQSATELPPKAPPKGTPKAPPQQEQEQEKEQGKGKVKEKKIVKHWNSNIGADGFIKD